VGQQQQADGKSKCNVTLRLPSTLCLFSNSLSKAATITKFVHFHQACKAKHIHTHTHTHRMRST